MPNLKLGRIFGILVWIHWTFFVLVALRGYAPISAGAGVRVAVEEVLFILLLFACVTLHEFGHALAARRFGIRTRDIILTPLGGLARLEGGRWTPTQELVIAVAGPAVNVLIALALLPIVALDVAMGDFLKRGVFGADFVTRLLLANVLLVVFNMIPAFPMDGGRVLRAVLGYFTDFRTSTIVAGRVGQVFAVGIGLLGVYTMNPLAFLIALFVFTAAGAEVAMAQRLPSPPPPPRPPSAA